METHVPVEPTKFLAADGSPMLCAAKVPNLRWSTQRLSPERRNQSVSAIQAGRQGTPAKQRGVHHQYQPHELPPQRSFDHHIELLTGTTPVNVRPYRYSPARKDEIEKQLARMLSDGIIKASTSPFASPVLLVRKKDNTWRFCIDYQQLNAFMVKNKHPMPIVEELIDELAGANWFSKLDFRAGYHQIRIAPDDTHKTAFKTHDGLYEFLVMPFGLTNATTTFQSIMNLIFRRLLHRGVLIFMDDILIYSKTLEEHMQLLCEVFDVIRANQFFIKLSKCSFAQEEVEYLGHIISSQGVATEPRLQ